MTQYGMLLDTQTCIGCLACTLACKVENASPPGVWLAPVLAEEVGTFPDVRRLFTPMMCMHCEDPACARACPGGAITRRKDGIVEVEKDKCCGSGACVIACPYGAIHLHHGSDFYFDEPTPFEIERQHDIVKGTALKCNLCASRVEQGLQPACVEACPTGSRIFGDVEDSQSEISHRLKSETSITLNARIDTRPQTRYLIQGIVQAGAKKEHSATGLEKQQLWDRIHALEFSLLGLGGGLFLSMLFWTGIDSSASKILRLLAAFLVAVGGTVLVSDLGRPFNFIQALRNQSKSWLSRGALADFIFILLMMITAIFPRQLNLGLLDLIAGISAVLVIVYPALSMAYQSSVGTWNTGVLVVSFLMDAISGGLALLAGYFALVHTIPMGISVALAVSIGLRLVIALMYWNRVKEANGVRPSDTSSDSIARESKNMWQIGLFGIGIIVATVLAIAGGIIIGSAGMMLTLGASISTLIGLFSNKLVALRTGTKPVQIFGGENVIRF